MHARALKTVAIVLSALFLLSLVPLFVAGAFSRPVYDDLYFAAATRHAWTDTHSLVSVLRAAVADTVATYRAYQGTFSAVFLWNLMPGIFGEKLYGLGAAFLLLSFVLAHAFFFATFLPPLGFSKASGTIVAVVAASACLQCTVSPSQGFFWFNGAVYYTFFYCLLLFSAALLYRYSLRPWIRRGRAGYYIVLPLAAVALGATNYSVALLFGVGYALYLLFLLVKRVARPLHFIVLACYAAAVLLSALCPGNALRAGMVTGADGAAAYTPPMAILQAIVYALRQCAASCTPELLGCVLACVPLMAAAAGRSRLRFRFPLLLTAASVLFLAVGWTPPVYLLGENRALRLTNILQYAFTLLLFLNVYWYVGWLRHTLLSLRERAGRPAPPHRVRAIAVCALLAVSAALCTLGSVKNDRYREYLSVACAGSLFTGNTQGYAAEMDARAAVLNDPAVQDAVLPALRHRPWILFIQDLSPDPDDPLNREAAYYYRKDSVRVETDGSVPEP